MTVLLALSLTPIHFETRRGFVLPFLVRNAHEQLFVYLLNVGVNTIVIVGD